MRALSTLAGLCLLFSSASCVIVIDDEGGHLFGIGSGKPGSGVCVTEVRAVEPFSRIHVSGSTDVVVEIGNQLRVDVSADDNLIQHLVTRVEDSTLRIGRDGGNYNFRCGPSVHVNVPSLDGLTISGSADVRVERLEGGSFKLHVSGSADVIANGSVQTLDASVSGSGDLSLFGLEAQDVRVHVSGSGDIEVTALNAIRASVSGSGDVRYRGNPSGQETTVTGSGSIKRD